MPSGSDDVIRRYDVVVIGAGPAGEAAAELGAARGLRRRCYHPLVKGGQVAPLLARGEDLLEALEGVLVGRLPRQHPLQMRGAI